ncbi:uncharacterized protein HGUI_00507 [Hanseniaspora guilliermondii]|uniref:Prokaryotic-type class I peptide chain release factors domain-containing protein n=1 Tax=Hanseniaspora guilliermondii TaxID=56406 RepID=A0A1L0B035_9ASCO|nr:uncharacterized protein HGUI_00507 [Hanseniaspora guilliermondii]
MFRSIINILTHQKRFYSISKEVKIPPEQIQKINEWIDNFNKDTVPKSCMSVQYVRSSGPGGQNVNKLSTKCSLEILNVKKSGFSLEKGSKLSGSQWIPQPLLHMMINGNVKTNYVMPDIMKLYYKPQKDSLVIQSDSERKRNLNEVHCFNKLQKIFKESFYVQKEVSIENKEKWQRIKERENEKRLQQKKFNQMRRKFYKDN